MSNLKAQFLCCVSDRVSRCLFHIVSLIGIVHPEIKIVFCKTQNEMIK